MVRALLAVLTAAASAVALGGRAEAACQLQAIAELHAESPGGAPIIDGTINGEPVRIMIDTGAGYSVLARSQAERLRLPKVPVSGAELFQVGGQTTVFAATVKQLRFGNFAARDLILWVTGDPDAPSGATLYLGEDFLSQYDVELDLAHGVVRLFDSKGCAPGQLDYWSAPYSIAPLTAGASAETEVEINGRRARGSIDSGAGRTLVDATAAEALGLGVDTGAVIGTATGLGPERREVRQSVRGSLKIGDETIANARFGLVAMAADFETGEIGSRVQRRLSDTPGVVLGDDFLRAHRVFIGNKEHVLVFSYNGGPVFAAPESYEGARSDKRQTDKLERSQR
jgi:predicted aspartyl protease